MTIDKAGSADDVDIIVAIDDDDATANNNNNEMTNDITIETEADTAADIIDDNTEMISDEIKIELDEEAPPLPHSPVVVEQEQQPPPLPDIQIVYDEDGRPWVIEQQKLPWWKRLIEAAMWIYHPLIFFIINVSLIVPLALTEQLVFVYCLACLWAPVFILIACRRNIQDYMARREEN